MFALCLLLLLLPLRPPLLYLMFTFFFFFLLPLAGRGLNHLARVPRKIIIDHIKLPRNSLYPNSRCLRALRWAPQKLFFCSLRPPRQHQRHHLLFLFLLCLLFLIAVLCFLLSLVRHTLSMRHPWARRQHKQMRAIKRKKEAVEEEVQEDDGDDDGKTERRK